MYPANGETDTAKAEEMGSELKTGFDCSVCKKHHDVLPLSYSIKAPRGATLIPEDELENRVVLTPDQCVVDGRDFYLRGRIPIPILGLGEPFIWGVWAEIGPKDFFRAMEVWNENGREAEPSFRGWLDTEIALFGDTINLLLDVHTQPVGRRPQFCLVDREHPLAIWQRDGITLEQVRQVAEYMLHGETQPLHQQ